MFNPWAILGGVLLLIAVAFGGAHVGKKLEREAWQVERIKMLADQTERLAVKARKDAALLQAQQVISRKAADAYEQALSELDQKYRSTVADLNRRGGLRITVPVARCAGPATTAEAAGAVQPHEEATATVRLPGDVERGLLELASSADQVVEQCRALQNWVRDNGLYGPTE